MIPHPRSRDRGVGEQQGHTDLNTPKPQEEHINAENPGYIGARIVAQLVRREPVRKHTGGVHETETGQETTP